MALNRSLSVRTYLLYLVIAIAVPLATVVGYSVYENSRQAVADANATVRTLAAVIAANTSRTLVSERERLEILAKRPLMRALDPDRCDPILADLRAMLPRFVNLATIDLKGREVCSAVPRPGGEPVNVLNTEWFQRALVKQRFLVGNPFRGTTSGRWVSVLVFPIRAEQNELRGFIGLPLDLNAFDPGIASASIPEGSRFGLVGGDGTLIWRNVDAEQLLGRNRSDLKAVKKMLAIEQGTFDELSVDGVRRFFAVAPVPGVGWYAYVGVPYSSIHGQAYANALRNSVLGLLGLLAVIVLALFLSRQIEIPIHSLAAAAHAIKLGNIDARAELKGPQEIVDVADEFNKMVDAWSETTRQLQASEERFRTVADYAGDWEYWEGPRGEIYYMSPSCESVTGYSREQFSSIPGLLDQVIHADDRSSMAAHRAFFRSKASGQLDFRIVRSDGDIRWIAHRCWAVHGLDGQFNGRRVNNRDITAHKLMEAQIEEFNEELELQVAQRTAQLRALSKELTMAEEGERHRLSLDLHDDLGQILAVVKLKLSSLKDPKREGGYNDLRRQVEEVESLVNQANRSVRSLSLQLSPPVLHQFGLVPALGWLAEELQCAYGLSVNVSDDGKPKPLGAASSNMLYRAVRELLINVHKHAKVGHAEVDIAAVEDRLTVSVSDSGHGFDTQRAIAPSAQGGYGLFSVRERISYIGGEMHIDSRPGDGTVVVLTLPLERRDKRRLGNDTAVVG